MLSTTTQNINKEACRLNLKRLVAKIPILHVCIYSTVTQALKRKLVYKFPSIGLLTYTTT